MKKHHAVFTSQQGGFSLSALLFLILIQCSGATAGVVNDTFRSRNILPLPELPGDGGGTGSSDFWKPFFDQGIKALNELSGCIDIDNFPKKKTTRAQRRVHQLVSDAYRTAYPDPSCFAECDGLQGLCSSSRLYSTGKSAVMPYAEGNISWPQVDSSPIPLMDCLPKADSEWLGSWHEHMLVRDGGSSNGDICTYVDPVLKNDKKAYGRFLSELHKRNMVKFRPAHGKEGILGIFFVKKKSGQLRLIFDTRKMNKLFIDPPKTDLPSADAFTRLETPEGQEFLIGSGDLANAFYTLAVPPDLAEHFTLPVIKAGTLREYVSGLEHYTPDTQLLPYLTILPMGWSWALHFCQSVLMHAIRSSGIEERQIIGDKRGNVCLVDDNDIAVAGYVDNFGIIGTNAAIINQGLGRISERLRALGLTVHEEEEAQHTGQFVGLHFNGHTGFVSISPKRLRNIKVAIDELLQQQWCSGRTLQLLTGHITWAMMARREGLSILSSTYAFINQLGSQKGRLWPAVRKELGWVSSLLPLFRMRISCGWANDITASDSSTWGLGVCCRKLDKDVVKQIGGQTERWRFRFQDAMQARKRALEDSCNSLEHHKNECISQAASLSERPSPPHGHSTSAFIVDQGFHDIPIDVLNPKDWQVVWSRPWKYRANILNTEARALTWSIEHLLRANRCINKRLLCLSDNMPLVLGCGKGRARSGHLLAPLRRIAALCLSTGSKVSTRWVVSEHNVADKPSRSVSAWQAAGLDRWWTDFVKDVDGFHSAATCDADAWSFQAPGKASCESSEEISPIHGPTRNDLSRNKKRQRSHNERLSDSAGPVQGLDSKVSTATGLARESGFGSCRIHSGLVRPGQEDRRWHQDSCGHQILPPKLGQTDGRNSSKNSSSSQRLEPSITEPTTSSSTVGGPRSSDRISGHTGDASTRAAALPSVCDVHETWRMFQPTCQADGCTSTDSGGPLHVFCHSTPSLGGQGPWKDRCVRRVSGAGQRCLDVSTPYSVGNGENGNRCDLGSASQRPCRPVCKGIGGPQLDTPQQLSLHPEARRCHSRHSHTKTVNDGSEAKGTLGLGFIPQKVCEAGSPTDRVSQSSHRCQKLRVRDHSVASQNFNKENGSTPNPSWNFNITKRMFKKEKAKPVRNMTAVQLLKQAFRRALKESLHGSKKVFLDLFCGDGGISRKLRGKGFGVVSIDIGIHPFFDLTDPNILRLIEGWIRGGCISGIWLATPCTSWSRASHGPVGSSWGPLRSRDHLFGFPGLCVGDQLKILLGNKTMFATARIIRCCRRVHVPCCFENPAGSMIWKVDPIARLCKGGFSRSNTTDFCQHGAKWRKRTRVQTWFCQPSDLLNKCCQGRHGLCSRTGRHHIILKGQDPVSKQLWTHLAQPYPASFCHAGANLLIDSADAISSFHLSRRFGG